MFHPTGRGNQDKNLKSKTVFENASLVLYSFLSGLLKVMISGTGCSQQQVTKLTCVAYPISLLLGIKVACSHHRATRSRRPQVTVRPAVILNGFFFSSQVPLTVTDMRRFQIEDKINRVFYNTIPDFTIFISNCSRKASLLGQNMCSED